MTAAEMQALAPAPEGCEWAVIDRLHLTVGLRRSPYMVPLHYGVSGSLHLVHGTVTASVLYHEDNPLDALLSLRRLAGHLWPWPGWPVVQGVRPAGWGPRPTAEERSAHRGRWLYRYSTGDIWLTWDTGGVQKPGDEPQFCAIDADGRWVEVDTRGAR